jgi:hypothetical protein
MLQSEQVTALEIMDRATCRDYLTSRSSGRRRSGGFESRALSLVRSSGDISSHNAFNSASVMRLSFILRSRAATDTKCAVSRLPPFASAARHSSSIARTESNRSSESTTSLSRYLTRRAHRLRSGWSITSRQLSSVRLILEAAGRARLGQFLGEVVALCLRGYHDWDIRQIRGRSKVSDIACGGGHLIPFLSKSLPADIPGIPAERLILVSKSGYRPAEVVDAAIFCQV